jgi:hypothetical protein
LRAFPYHDGKITRNICKGTELLVLAVQGDWLYINGGEKDFTGWILRQWISNDIIVWIESDKKRKALAPEISRLEAIVKPIPRSKWKKNLSIYKQLLYLDPCNEYYQRKVDFYENYGRGLKKPARK